MTVKALVTKKKHFGLPIYVIGNKEYAVGTDDEADKAARQAVEQSLWSFSAETIVDFVSAHRIKLTSKDFDRLKQGIEIAQTKASEDAHDLVLGLIGEQYLGLFCEAAIRSEGRGHFLSQEDGIELNSGRVSGLPKNRFAYQL
jgi:hypothetical protein